MKRNRKCPKGGSTDIIADAKAIDRNESFDNELTVATFRKPNAILFKGQQESTLSAWVCADCGYVEFYANSPRALKLTDDPA